MLAFARFLAHQLSAIRAVNVSFWCDWISQFISRKRCVASWRHEGDNDCANKRR